MLPQGDRACLAQRSAVQQELVAEPLYRAQTGGDFRQVDLQQERQVSSIVVTHDLRSVKALADRVALLHEGKILIEGTFEDLKSSDDPFVSEFLQPDF